MKRKEKMEIINITRDQACCFLLRKQGLSGAYQFKGKQGIMEYIRQAGCIQFDPVDVCGKNAELVLQSRIKGFTKEMPLTLQSDCFRFSINAGKS